MDCKIYANGIKNQIVKAPPSKSVAHRAILGAMLADEPCVVDNVSLSADVMATLASAKALGKECSYCDGKVFFGAKKQVEKTLFYDKIN